MSPSTSGSGVRPHGDTPIRFRVLPLRLLVAGRFGLPKGQLHRLDPAGVAGLLERSAPNLALRVPDRLRADGTALPVNVGFRHRRDFAPGAIARAVPDLARLVESHDSLRAGTAPETVHGRLADLPAVHRALTGGTPPAAAPASPAAAPPPDAPPSAAPSSAAPPSAAPPKPAAPTSGGDGGDDLDRLLGMVDTPVPSARPESETTAARSVLDSFISEVSRSSTRPATAGTPPEALEAALAEQIEEILDHPDFRAVERGWAALRFLVRRIDLRAGITVEVVEADADALADALEALVPDDDPDPAGPVRIVVDLNDYDASDRDVGRLRRLAAFGASRRAVVLANADPGFAGETGLEALAGMHDPETLFEESRFAAWRTLRDDPQAVWIGLCLSRIALRDASDGREDKTLKFLRPRRIGRVLDVGVAPAVAALLAAAAGETDWACAVGAGAGTSVDDLILVADHADGFEGPVRPALSTASSSSLSAAGLITLVPERGRDTARLMRMPSVRRAGNRDAMAEASLPTRLFQAQIVHGLQWNADRLFAATGAEALRDVVQSYLTSLLSGTGPGAAAEVRLDRDDDGDTILAIHVRSGSTAAPGASMSFDIPLGSGPSAGKDDS